SRAVLGVQNADGSWQAVPLTDDHQPSNPRELERLINDHPGEENTVAFRSGRGPMRVLGGMMPSRAFGDAMYKWPLSTQRVIEAVFETRGAPPPMMSRTPPYCRTPPYMTASPEIIHRPLAPTDRFLIIATDGLFDALTSSEAVQIVSDHLCGMGDTDGGGTASAASALVWAALSASGGGSRAVSVMLTLPKGESRKYRDDITVLVVVFERPGAQGSAAGAEGVSEVEVPVGGCKLVIRE
ncbi:phosphatase 2C-like domain-containing protein, partial [Blyttiomyces helicus]